MGSGVEVKLSSQTLGTWFLRLLSIAGVVVAAINPDSLPASLRTAFAIGSAVILAVDRYVSDPSTGTTNLPPNYPVIVSGSTSALTKTQPPEVQS